MLGVSFFADLAANQKSPPYHQKFPVNPENLENEKLIGFFRKEKEFNSISSNFNILVDVKMFGTNYSEDQNNGDSK